MADTGASLLVTDFGPLRLGRQWREGVTAQLQVPFHEVDTHNIVPVWIASGACVRACAASNTAGAHISCRGVRRAVPGLLPAVALQMWAWINARAPVLSHVHAAAACCCRAEKREYAARTIRPRITSKLPEFLREFPELPLQVNCGAAASSC